MPRMEQSWILKEKLGAYDAEVWTKKLKSWLMWKFILHQSGIFHDYSTMISAVTFSPSSLQTIPIAGTEKSGIPFLSQ